MKNKLWWLRKNSFRFIWEDAKTVNWKHRENEERNQAKEKHFQHFHFTGEPCSVDFRVYDDWWLLSNDPNEINIHELLDQKNSRA